MTIALVLCTVVGIDAHGADVLLAHGLDLHDVVRGADRVELREVPVQEEQELLGRQLVGDTVKVDKHDEQYRHPVDMDSDRFTGLLQQIEDDKLGHHVLQDSEHLFRHLDVLEIRDKTLLLLYLHLFLRREGPEVHQAEEQDTDQEVEVGLVEPEDRLFQVVLQIRRRLCQVVLQIRRRPRTQHVEDSRPPPKEVGQGARANEQKRSHPDHA
mmetsp:Transcript_170675/g.542237  ORF Transcript_170675/g.542237 Transcript_170675/m.542237 type:complete len:212 (+) Transcript_170675:2593-3228(+)